MLYAEFLGLQMLLARLRVLYAEFLGLQFLRGATSWFSSRASACSLHLCTHYAYARNGSNKNSSRESREEFI